MSVRKTVGAWAAVLVVAAGLATGFGVTAGGAAPQPYKPRAQAQLPKPTPAAEPDKAQRRPEEERLLQLHNRSARLKEMKVQLEQNVREQNDRIRRIESQVPNPHVVKALGEILTRAELEIFQTQLDISKQEHSVSESKLKLQSTDKESIPAYTLDQYVARLAREHSGLRDLSERMTRKHWELDTARKVAKDADQAQLKRLQEEIDKLHEEYAKALEPLKAQAQQAIRESRLEPIRKSLADAEVDLRLKQRMLTTLEQRRAAIVKTLSEGSQQSADLELLQSNLRQTRDVADQITRELLMLEMEMSGVKPGDFPARPADDKLDRILRELAELKAEVRQLREQQKK